MSHFFPSDSAGNLCTRKPKKAQTNQVNIKGVQYCRKFWSCLITHQQKWCQLCFSLSQFASSCCDHWRFSPHRDPFVIISILILLKHRLKYQKLRQGINFKNYSKLKRTNYFTKRLRSTNKCPIFFLQIPQETCVQENPKKHRQIK